mgnify:CR=1 FL=1
MEGELQVIPTSQLVLNSYNARRFKPNAAFTELVASVRQKGVITPILARPLDTGKYEVVAGERRTRAAQIVSEETGDDLGIPSFIKNLSDDEAWECMGIENLLREDLSVFEQSQSFKDYLDRHEGNPEALTELSYRTGISSAVIQSRVALLSLPKPVVESWEKGELSLGHVEELTRIEDEKGILAAYTAIFKDNLSVVALKDYIKKLSPDLNLAFFPKAQCDTCLSNTATQCSLFPDSDGSKCLNPACFEAKQTEFITSNWERSKLRANYKTNGFKFQHNVPAAQRRALSSDTPAERCLDCPEFVSIITLVGKAVKGFEKCCVGVQTCYSDLYEQKKKAGASKAKAEGAEEGKGAQTASATPAAKGDKKATAKEAKPKDELNKNRAQTHREAFYKEAIPAAISKVDPESVTMLRLALAAIMILDHDFRSASSLTEESIESLQRKIIQKAEKVIMSSASSNASSRDEVAAHILGIDLSREWKLNDAYLKDLTKIETVKVGEDLGLWDLPEIATKKAEKYKKKGLMSLKNGELSELILKSGADLSGRVPKEILVAGRSSGAVKAGASENGGEAKSIEPTILEMN